MRTYGVTRNIRTEIKLQGPLTLNDAAIYAVFLILALLIGSIFPPIQSNQKLIFYVLMMLFAFWLTMKPITNPGKRNYQIMFFMIKKNPHFFKSLNFYEFESKPIDTASMHH